MQSPEQVKPGRSGSSRKRAAKNLAFPSAKKAKMTNDQATSTMDEVTNSTDRASDSLHLNNR